MSIALLENVAIEPAKCEPLTLRKRIGSTVYEVSVYFSGTSNETMEDKIIRIIGREVTKSA